MRREGGRQGGRGEEEKERGEERWKLDLALTSPSNSRKVW